MAGKRGLFLITGIAGFIGSGLARHLLEHGETVRGIDNFSTGKPENIASISGEIDFREVDLSDSTSLAKACEGVNFVLHEAAIPSVPRSISDPLTSHNANVNGTLNLLMACRAAGVKRVVYAASSSAYGESPTLPKCEEMRPAPISPYGVGKLAGELYMQCFTRAFGLETVSLRYFNVFGPRQDAASPYSGVLAKFIRLMLQGEQPTIFGDGTQSRDFTYLDNAILANLLACDAPSSEVAGKVFNVATGSRFNLNSTFRLLKKIIGFEGKPNYSNERTGDIKHSLADITQARKHLGYEPLVDFEEGLRRTVEWYKQQLGHSRVNLNKEHNPV